MSDNSSSNKNEVNNIDNIGNKLDEIEKYIDEFFPSKAKIKVTPDLRVIDKIFSEDFKNGKPPKIPRKKSIFKLPIKKPLIIPVKKPAKQPIKEKPTPRKDTVKKQKDKKEKAVSEKNKIEKKKEEKEKKGHGIFFKIRRKEKKQKKTTELPNEEIAASAVEEKEKEPKRVETVVEEISSEEKGHYVQKTTDEIETEFQPEKDEIIENLKEEQTLTKTADLDTDREQKIEISAEKKEVFVQTPGDKLKEIERVPVATEEVEKLGEGAVAKELDTKTEHEKQEEKPFLPSESNVQEHIEKNVIEPPKVVGESKEVSKEEETIQRIPLKLEFGKDSDESEKMDKKEIKHTIEREEDEKKIAKAFRKSKVKGFLKRDKEKKDKTVKPLVDLSMKNLIGELLQSEKEDEKKDLVDVEENAKEKKLEIPSKEELVEHVLFDEDDPFFFDNSVQPPQIGEGDEFSKFSDDVELPRESLRFQPYVEFQSAEDDEEINIPVESDEFEEIDFYPLYKPFAYVKILREKKTVDKIYALLEPELSEEEQKILNFLNDTLSSTVKVEIEKLEKISAEKYLEDELNQIISDYKLSISEETKQKVMYIMKRDLVGYGKIDALMRDPNIEDISCDGANIPVFVYHRKHGSLRTNINFKNEEELSSFVIRLAQKCGKHISIAEPMLDATMPDGSRIQMTLSTEI
ncbi:MAG: type II/IV secretion system ATPase subunit, partial [Thermoplasmata archaeon]|nr:type II/IV secretion system ATPase subunit [Thermoplasmata archaeon]